MTQIQVHELMHWYARQCDGDWEHKYGVKIETLDNPGWSLKIDLTGTELAQKSVPMQEQHTSDTEWIVYKIEDEKFVGACGATGLNTLIEKFIALTNESGT